MKQFQSFVLKEFKQIFRDRRTSLILLVLPIVEVLLLGYAITTELNNAAIAVFDPSKDAETRQISERWCGRTGTNRMVHFLPESGVKPGTLRQVRITRAGSVSLFGELL